ncbi:thiamine phosphate synthase [Colwellia sp. Arc7-635]|nr:thiamine phosphate synthase [Colwellia sp. Arc7-635]
MSSKHKPIIWTISGADCSGGAGIAADIKTGHNLHVEVCHLITANTVQNSTGLSAIHPVEVAILAEQAQALRFDKPPSVIKIGLIANSVQLTWLVTLLSALKQQLPNLQVVYDPVGQASVGGSLTTLITADLLSLIPLVNVITPNYMEAKKLNQLWQVSDSDSDSDSDNQNSITDIAGNITAQNIEKNVKNSAEKTAEHILKLGCQAVIIKGGHTDNEQDNNAKTHCIDLCLQRLSLTSTQTLILQSPKINSHYSHGGGCSFASALASFLAHGYLLRDAFTLTKAFINQGLALTAETESAKHNRDDYYGAFEQTSWPTTLAYFPKVIGALNQQVHSLLSFKPLDLADEQKLGLYPVIDSLEWLERLLPLNLNIIQLRIKNKSSKELDSIIEKAVTLARLHSCRLFINDHWQLAIKHGAYGVHIGQEDLANANLTAIADAGLRLGISTHGCYEFLLAKQIQSSYLAIGAIFPTKTKNMTGQIQGVENLRQILQLAEHIPVVAIGGISQQRLKQVSDTGVSGVAVVTAITEAEQPIIAAKNMQTLLTEDD